MTSPGRTIMRAVELAERYGTNRFCRGHHACGSSVPELETHPTAMKLVTEHCR